MDAIKAKALAFLESRLNAVKLDLSREDEAAGEWFDHISSVIDDVRADRMTIDEAEASLGINIRKRCLNI